MNSTANEDMTTRLWDAATLTGVPIPVPPWMRDYARAVAGLEFDDDGEIKSMTIDRRLSVLNNPPKDNGRWAVLARWIATPAGKRTLTPDSKLTFRQIAERERDFNGVGTVESLTSALEDDYTLPLTRLLLANAPEKANAAKKTAEQDATIPACASFLRRYDFDCLPDDPVLWTRAAKALNDAPPGAMVGIDPKAIHPTAAQADLERAKKARNP